MKWWGGGDENIPMKEAFLAEKHGGTTDSLRWALRVSRGLWCMRCVWIYYRYTHGEGSVRKHRLERDRFRKSQDRLCLTSVSKGTHKLLSYRGLLRNFFCNPRGRSLPGCYCQEDSGDTWDIWTILCMILDILESVTITECNTDS